MSTDRELLELAAKAAGIEVRWVDVVGEFVNVQQSAGLRTVYWNPFTDDGDALRLAMTLNMSVDVDANETSTYAYVGPSPRQYAWELWGNDKDAATRRAIVRAAAEIGRSTS